MIVNRNTNIKNISDRILNVLNDILLCAITYEIYNKSSILYALISFFLIFYADSFILAVSSPGMSKLNGEMLAKQLSKHMWKISIFNLSILIFIKVFL